MKTFLTKAKTIFTNSKFYCGLVMLLSLSTVSYGKPSSKLRGFFNALHLNFSSGYGMTSYQTMIYKYKAFFKDGQLYLYNKDQGPQTPYLVQLYSKPYIHTHLYNSQNSLVCHHGLLTLEGMGHMVPLTLSAHVDIKKKLRLEIGGSVFMHKIKELKPTEPNENFGTYNDPVGTHYSTKVFISLGHKLMENTFYTLLVNTQISYDFFYNDIFKDDYAVAANYWFPPAIGIGLTFEKHISEYMSWFCKLNYEKLRILEKPDPKFGGYIYSERDSIFLQVGLTLTCGEIPTCPIPNCKIEGKHNHGEKTYRGVPIGVGKNSKGYKNYKK